MHLWIEVAVRYAVITGQYVFGAVAIYTLLQLFPQRRSRWKHLAVLSWRTKQVPSGWLRLFRISRKNVVFTERELLLAGCGVSTDAAWYVIVRKIVLCALIGAFLLAVLFQQWLSEYMSLTIMLPTLSILLFFVYIDLTWLRSIRKVRTLQVTKEIYVVSNQLLYLSDSSLHLHAKLMRCLPFTRALRGDLESLLAEWYHDAGEALQHFKHRIGTDEALSFVETLDALRLHESKQYYALLRVRIEDYKEKLELAKESRKESTSYLLFVIAGIPILYTFQIFIYPWVREGQKLLHSIG